MVDSTCGGRRPRRSVLAVMAAASLIMAAGCGGSSSSDDADRDRNIAGGIEATQENHPAPYQVVVYRVNPNNEARLPKDWWQFGSQWVYVCSGVILNSRWVATTSNCLSTEGKPWDAARFHIGVGKVDPWSPVEWDNQPTFTYGVESAIVAGGWDNYALLKTDRPLDFEGLKSVRPIDLPFGLDDSWPAKGEIGQISGYGFQRSTGQTTSILRTAITEVLADAGDDTCGAWGDFDSATRICLGKANVATGGLACPFDWGGPLVINVAQKPMLAGIISEVDRLGDCANGGATLAIRMRSMVRWIAGGAIRDFTATPDDSSVTLSWGAPRAVWFTESEDPDWNPGVSDYTIEMSEDGGKNWFTIADDKSTDTQLTIGGLDNGKEYAFRVAALNEIIADRSDYRYYSPVATVTVGKQEPPATVPDVGVDGAPGPAARPTLDGQEPQGAADVKPVPAGVDTAKPNDPSSPTTGPIPVTTASRNLSTFNPLGAAGVAKIAKVDVPAGARVTMTVDKSSKKICAVRGAALVALTAGKCKVKVAVATGKGKPKTKSTTITVSK